MLPLTAALLMDASRAIRPLLKAKGMFKTNGWQRLWIVISVLYLCAVIVIDIMIWPKTAHIEKQFLNATYQLIYEAEGKKEKYKFTDIVEEANRRGLFSNPKDEKEQMMAGENWVALAERAISKYNDKINFANIRNTYDFGLRKVNSERKEIVLFSVIFCFLPVVALYLLGLSIRWIIRGFKQKK